MTVKNAEKVFDNVKINTNHPKLKILILSWEIYPMYYGGLGFLVKSLVDELRNQNVDVTILVPQIISTIKDAQVVSLEENITKYLKKSIDIPKLDYKLTKLVAKPDKTSESPLKETIYPNKTPIVAKAYALAFGDYLTENNDFDLIIGMDWVTIPSFVQYQNLGYKTPFAFYINATEIDRVYGCRKILKTSALILELEGAYYKKSESIITVSNVSKQNLVQRYGVDDSKITVVYNDITYVPYQGKIVKHSKQVLFLGRMIYQKGLIFLLRVAKKVVKVNKDVVFVLAGEGVERTRIEKFIQKNNLTNNVKIIAWVDGDTKSKLYAESSLFYMPSVSEPFGLTALEAIRSNTPIIASNRCGFCGIVSSTPVFDYDDIQTQVDLILDLLNNPVALKNLLLQQQLELKAHSWPFQVSQVIKLASKS